MHGWVKMDGQKEEVIVFSTCSSHENIPVELGP